MAQQQGILTRGSVFNRPCRVSWGLSAHPEPPGTCLLANATRTLRGTLPIQVIFPN